MKNRKTIVFANMVLVVIVFAIIILIQQTQNSLQAQTQTETQPQTESQDERAARILKIVQQNGDPVADFAPLQSADEETWLLRKAKGLRFNQKSSEIKPSQKYLIEIGDRTPPISFLGPLSNLRDQPALPVDKSPQIVVGKITMANAFISDDWTAIYTEFGFRVEQVLKDTANVLQSTQFNVTLLRWGGKAKLLASERIIHKGISVRPLPKLEKRYLFFLTYEPAVKAYYIDIAYELKDGKVIPVDGRDVEGNYHNRFKSYQQYEGKDEREFIQAVIRTIGSATVIETGDKKQLNIFCIETSLNLL